MQPEDFRKLALAIPNCVEESHMGHPDFRMAGKIFATLGPTDSGWATVRLTPSQQQSLLEAHPQALEPCAGAWGKCGYTRLTLSKVSRSLAQTLLTAAAENLMSTTAKARWKRSKR